MRLLPAGPDHVRGGAAQGGAEAERRRHRRGDERQHLPLRHLPAHSRRGAPRGRDRWPRRPHVSAPGLSRRAFIARSAAAGGGLLIGLSLPSGLRRIFAQQAWSAPAPKISPNAFIRIAPDDTVTILLKHSEMGQGVSTSLPMVVAEELECDWRHVRSEHAPADIAYAHTVFHSQMTGGSTSTWESFDQLRTAGAAAREMLIAAAAARWGVPAGECRAENGFVIHGERRARFGELAADAEKLPVPAAPKLKDPKDWKIIGQATHRLDSPVKVSGQAEFGM